MRSLLKADSAHILRITDISDEKLSRDLSSYGIFKNSYVRKIDSDDSTLPTLKVHCKNGTISIPGHLAKYITLKLSPNNDKSIYEVEEGKTGTISKIDDVRGCLDHLSRLGIKKGIRVKILRQLPHMEYVVLVDNRRRVHLTEGLAATIVGVVKNESKQLSFARRGKDFIIKDIVQNEEYTYLLSKSGIVPERLISLEGIEAGKDISFDDSCEICIYTAEGYRLGISTETASKIMVIQD